jgi:5-methylthioadenosine/S-adenosylhomocysteine deaminase
VRHTIVDGRIVVRDRRLTLVDEADLLTHLRGIEPQLRADAIALRKSASSLEPYYRQMVRQAAARDVGFTRWVGR